MNSPVRNKFDLETPCLVLDLPTLEQNIHRLQSIANKRGKKLRPHAKTHKCSTLAKKQIEAGSVGVCAAKVSEAERLTAEGIENVLLTGPFASQSATKRVVGILRSHPSLMVTVDSGRAVQNMSDALSQAGIEADVLLDIDVGLRRTGAIPSDALALADFILSRPNLRLRGIQAYAGQLQHVFSFEERRKASHGCLEDVIPVFNELRSKVEGFTIFSASGTGTFEIDSDIHEVTEHQVGSYVTMDAEYLAIESSEGSKRFTTLPPALRLLTTVVSANQRGFVTVDAGLKTLYKDGGIPQVISPEFAGTTYDWFGDEYGKISSTEDGKLPPLGTVLELVTSHCDPTINLFDRFYITEGDEVVDVWQIDLRGCSQ